MFPRRLTPALLGLALIGLPACIDADIQTKLNKDGTGTMSMKMGLTDGFVEVLGKLKEIDPDADVMESAKDIYFDEPSAEDKAAMKAAGCELVSFEGERSDTKIYSKFEVAFDHLSKLTELDRIRPEGSDAGDGPGQNLTLVKNDDGSYTLAMADSDDDAEDEDPFADSDEAEDDGPEVEEDPEEAMKKAAAAMELMGEMMAEASNLKIVVAMEVPGEVVSHSPDQFAKVDGGKVTWTIDFASMMGGGMGPDAMDGGFSVTFKMPEGESIPEEALNAPKKK